MGLKLDVLIGRVNHVNFDFGGKNHPGIFSPVVFV
jgi:hypothetical protein